MWVRIQIIILLIICVVVSISCGADLHNKFNIPSRYLLPIRILGRKNTVSANCSVCFHGANPPDEYHNNIIAIKTRVKRVQFL